MSSLEIEVKLLDLIFDYKNFFINGVILFIVIFELSTGVSTIIVLVIFFI